MKSITFDLVTKYTFHLLYSLIYNLFGKIGRFILYQTYIPKLAIVFISGGGVQGLLIRPDPDPDFEIRLDPVVHIWSNPDPIVKIWSDPDPVLIQDLVSLKSNYSGSIISQS